MSISNNIDLIRQTLPGEVKLVCVSKFNPAESILEAYNAGERIFGESKVQEMVDKFEKLPEDIHWHFIGHLQTNKVKFIVPFVELIHGVDSLRLAEEINKQAGKVHRPVNCLLQVHIASEETKFGFSGDELIEYFESGVFISLENVRIRGLMGMATFTSDTSKVREEFRHLKQLFEDIKKRYLTDCIDFSEISMGMSDDYKIAIEEGSTMVRIGSSIFGHRVY
jgi:PLP dependent protein